MALITVELTNQDLGVELPGGYLLYGARRREVDGSDAYVQVLLSAGLIRVVSTGGDPGTPTLAYTVYAGDTQPSAPGPWLFFELDTDGDIVSIGRDS